MKCRPVESSFTSPKITTCRCARKHVGEKRLVHPRAADGAARVADDGVKNLEAAPARDREIGGLDLAEHRRLGAGPQRGNRLHAAAVLVAERQSVQQIFDDDEAGAFEVRGLPRTHAFQKLERCREKISSLWTSLHDDSLTLSDFDLTDTCRQRERFVDADPPGSSAVRE